MAPRLSSAQRTRIHSLILRRLANCEIADIVRCTERAVRRIRARLDRFGATTAPANRAGPDPKMTPVIRNALFEQLTQRPVMLRREMAAFVYNRFGVEVRGGGSGWRCPNRLLPALSKPNAGQERPFDELRTSETPLCETSTTTDSN
ncbi:hypothetical protein QBC34DRAFT_148344 [Podospora aff. communis PSN243]|uniref:Transposase n=1 Tax=Podospora aff. communis PSN243 TaxID=3040156 RepID=A0AAV9GFQ3_9PEZI|nr:hypothetical protein QBC34DRAFT_148344 [Podospora aff. communis PSN243]